MSEDYRGGLMKLASNELTIVGWRAGVALLSACGTIMIGLALAWLSDIRASQSVMNERFVAFQLSNEVRLGKVEGELGQVKGSVAVHRERILKMEVDMGEWWKRFYDFKMFPDRPNSPPQQGRP